MINYPSYINCQDLLHILWKDRPPVMCFHSQGFSSDSKKMSHNGWVAKYEYNKYTRLHVIRFLHSTLRLTFRITGATLESLCKLDTYVAFNPYKKSKYTVIDHDYTADDVPDLLELIVRLQKPERIRQIQKMELPSASIVFYKSFNSY